MIKNARIAATMLGREDHGIMSFAIYIEFDSGMCCGIGNYELDEWDPKVKARVSKSKSIEVISKILDVVGVKTWEDLPGKYIRFEDNGFETFVTKIGNIMEDKWLDFKEFFPAKGETK